MRKKVKDAESWYCNTPTGNRWRPWRPYLPGILQLRCIYLSCVLKRSIHTLTLFFLQTPYLISIDGFLPIYQLASPSSHRRLLLPTKQYRSLPLLRALHFSILQWRAANKIHRGAKFLKLDFRQRRQIEFPVQVKWEGEQRRLRERDTALVNVLLINTDLKEEGEEN